MTPRLVAAFVLLAALSATAQTFSSSDESAETPQALYVLEWDHRCDHENSSFFRHPKRMARLFRTRDAAIDFRGTLRNDEYEGYIPVIKAQADGHKAGKRRDPKAKLYLVTIQSVEDLP